MKRSFVLTITGKNGLRQYKISKALRIFLLGVLVLLLVSIAGLAYYTNVLNQEVKVLKASLVKEISKPNGVVETDRQKGMGNTVHPEPTIVAETSVKEENESSAVQGNTAQQGSHTTPKTIATPVQKSNENNTSTKSPILTEEQALKEKQLQEEKRKKEALKKLKKELEKKKKKPKPQNRAKKSKSILPIAKAKLGRRYVWGATGPKTFDCSGFTKYVYKQKGINIPRTSRQQAQYGKYITRRSLQPGDLVFFDTGSPRKGFVNHVGIYMGNNKFIHASSAKKRVIITRLDKSFYSARYKGARRILH